MLGLARLGVENVEHDAVAFALEVHRGAGVVERDHDAALACASAPEVDVRDLDALRGRNDLGRVGAAGAGGGAGGADQPVVDREDHVVAVDAAVVAGDPEQVDHDARASGGFDDRYTRGGARADLDAPLAEAVAGVGEVERDARRRLGREHLRVRDRSRELHRQFDLAARQGGIGQVLEHVLGLRRRGERDAEHGEDSKQASPCRPQGGPALGSCGRSRAHEHSPQ